ncbi:hypothetical protein LJR005_001076 [Rossellomorea sp. LjRoot5]
MPIFASAFPTVFFFASSASAASVPVFCSSDIVSFAPASSAILIRPKQVASSSVTKQEFIPVATEAIVPAIITMIITASANSVIAIVASHKF